MALASCQLVCAEGPSSANYAIPLSTLNAGVGDISSTNYKASSSLGDPFTGAMSSAGYRLNPGFWTAVIGGMPLCLLDIDGDGAIDPLTDGLMLVRAMFGLTGPSVTTGAIGNNPQRTTWGQIQPYIHFSALDVDGNNATDALTDGLMLMRAMFGLTGSSVTNGAVAAGAPRATWLQIQPYLNGHCGTNFAP